MSNMETTDSPTSEYIPKWKVPISKSFSFGTGGGGGGDSSNSPSESPERQSPNDEEDSSSSSRDKSQSHHHDDQSPSLTPLSKRSTADGKSMEEDDSSALIQILLPCIICNRTFSPEALERHNKVCTKVNVKSPYKQDRGQFKSEEQRKKGTKVEYFIPPPNFESEDPRLSCLSRGSRTRSSLRGTSCTTRSTINAEALHLHQQQQNLHGPTGIPSVWRRQRSISGTRGGAGDSRSIRASSKAPSDITNNFYDDNSEFGSNNSEESHTIPDSSDTTNLPSYAKPIAPTDECPYCNRCFGPKAYDRHVQYCKEKYVQRQYELQPVPKEKIEALERQEIRTKYRPMKSSSSCSSLRSVSPGKDFASMAFKLFGGIRRTDGTNNLYNNQLHSFKKSNESLANSCYGDFTRGMRRPSPSPARGVGMGIIDSRKNSSGSSSNSVTNKINNLLSKTFHMKQNSSNNNNNPMRMNTSSNIPLAKSSDNLGGLGANYTHVSSSGYGQQSNYNNNNNFSRNSRSRSSLHKNFFRSKRVEPEGTENTTSYPLIITPMTFYTKSGKGGVSEEMYRSKGPSSLLPDPSGGQSPSSSSYDPYEMAAKQLEELLKAQPIQKNVNKKTARKLGLEKAFESVGVHSPGGFLDGEPSGEKFLSRGNSRGKSHDENNLGRKSNESPFVFEMGSGKMDDSYWDEILQKSHSGGSMLGNVEQGRNQLLRGSHLLASSSSSGDTKSQQSDSGSVSDGKSRAMSHISSADSGFSRSDANDSEFEVLESMVGVGEMPQQQQQTQQNNNNKSHNGGFLSSSHASLARMLQKPQQQIRRPSYSSENRESPMQISPTPVTPSDDGADPWKKTTSPTAAPPPAAGAKFCHQCGSPYPTGIAKFCSECGEKRVFK